jgi:hypothetical protein
MARKLRGIPIIIPTEWGPVTEKIRLGAAINMKLKPEIKQRVETMLIMKYGKEQGLIQSKLRYPEAYE